METKTVKIEKFLNSLDKEELTERQTSMVLRGFTANEDTPEVVNNCGNGVNCVDGCGNATNGLC